MTVLGVMAGVSVLTSTTLANAHGGDPDKVHACIQPGGLLRIVAATDTCRTGESALDWSKTGGLDLETVFTALRTDDRTGSPSPNDTDGFVHWNNLEGMPTHVFDGDDDGSAKVAQLKEALSSSSDGIPNEGDDLVSFNEVKDLVGVGGNGRIDSQFIKDGTIRSGDLAGSYSDTGVEDVVGAVVSAKIADGSIESRDLSPALLARLNALELRLAQLERSVNQAQ